MDCSNSRKQLTLERQWDLQWEVWFLCKIIPQSHFVTRFHTWQSIYGKVQLSVCSINIKIDSPRLHASVMKRCLKFSSLFKLKSYKLKYNMIKNESFKHTMIFIHQITCRSSWSGSVMSMLSSCVTVIFKQKQIRSVFKINMCTS